MQASGDAPGQREERIQRMRRELPDDGRATARLIERELTGSIIECFFVVYNTLGYGFLESVYRSALALELRQRGLDVRAEAPIEVIYRGERVGAYRLDLLVENKIAPEVKATELLAPTAKRQLLNYLRASALDVGLLLHFAPDPKFYRVVSPRALADPREEQIRPFP
jgi:GxxExxY protein